MRGVLSRHPLSEGQGILKRAFFPVGASSPLVSALSVRRQGAQPTELSVDLVHFIPLWSTTLAIIGPVDRESQEDFPEKMGLDGKF